MFNEMTMKKLLLIFFHIIFTLAVYCQSDNESKIFGEWYDYSQSKFSFNRENIFQLHFGNKLLINGKYSFIANDTLRVFVEDNFFIDYVYAYFNDTLILYTYKNHNGTLKNHLDEITLLTKRNSVKKPIDTLISLRNDKFILPDNYIGLVYVNFNQFDGQVQNFDNAENRIIRIPDCGYTKTIFKENPLKYALEKMCFIQSETNIPFFIERKIRRMNEKELEEAGYNLESIYVCIEGYNQTSRKYINEIYGQEIQGNVLMFKIDTLKNILSSWKKY